MLGDISLKKWQMTYNFIHMWSIKKKQKNKNKINLQTNKAETNL